MIIYLPWLPNPKGVPAFVLDVSVTVAWRLPVSRTIYPNMVLHRIIRSVAVVPENWALDLAEQMRLGVRAGKLSDLEATRFLTALWSFNIWVDNETSLRAWSDTFILARAHRLAVDDAAYLELALRLKLPLATTDATLTRAATAAGVPIFTP